MNILIFGITGMLGNTMFRFLSKYTPNKVIGVGRNKNKLSLFDTSLKDQIICLNDVNDTNELKNIFLQTNPDLVINCIGVVKQIKSAENPLTIIPINSLLPHILSQFCKKNNSKFIHFSTDCVFNGEKGFYNENDQPNAKDLYGLSKFLGEVHYNKTITIRTSIIGHEINSNNSLVDWFLSKDNYIEGYKNAFFSGLPTIEIASIVNRYFINNPSLHGLFNIAGEKISKFDLLNKIAKEYDKKILIKPNYHIKIDRSLNADKFNKKTKYCPPNWDLLIKKMKENRYSIV